MSVLGNYDNQYPLVSTADIGGHRVLGMSGSLTNYINTGNANIPSNDTFSKKTDKKETKKPSFLNKIVSSGAPVTGVVITVGILGALLVKSIKTGDFTKFLNACGDKVGKFFKGIPDKFSQLMKKLPTKNKP